MKWQKGTILASGIANKEGRDMKGYFVGFLLTFLICIVAFFVYVLPENAELIDGQMNKYLNSLGAVAVSFVGALLWPLLLLSLFLVLLALGLGSLI